MTASIVYLNNVRLETGFAKDHHELTYTKTARYTLAIQEGKIQAIIPQNQVTEKQQGTDLNGQLAIPAFQESHNHLDKTYLSLGWRASQPVKNLKERLADEASELKLLAPSTEQRATAMIEKLIGYGASYIRTHVNIDPYVELENFWGVKNPQTVLLMREALKNGGTMVGGLDPAGIDYAIEESLETIFDLAEEFQVGIDIHLHDTGEVGVYTIDKFLDILEERKFTQRTAISHAFALLDVRPAEKEKLYQRLATHQTAIMSTIPYDPRYLLPPIDVLRQTGVSVHLGSDGFFDSWSSNVSGDLFEKLRNFCEMTGKITEEQLTQAYVHGCGKEAPFSFEEERLWFTEGDEANFIFTEAASTAEVIARKPQKRKIMLKGQWV